MAEAKNGNERVRLAVLLTVLAAAVVVVTVRFLGGAGIGGGTSRSAQLDYEARNLQPLATDPIGRHDERPVDSEGNPFTFRPPPTPTPNLTPPPTPIPRPTMPPRPTPTPRTAVGADGEPKPPPPPFDREYIVHFGPGLTQVAAFRKQGDEPGSKEIDVAVVGTVLDGIFIVREIGLESVVIGFVGYAPSEDTRVPLAEE
jgi:hypothetical protein